MTYQREDDSASRYRVAAEGVRIVREAGTPVGTPAGLAHAWEVGTATAACGCPLVNGQQSPLHTFPDAPWATSPLDFSCPTCLAKVPRHVGDDTPRPDAIDSGQLE